ncbi:hypothetical protein [Eshraghiella crossota]
MNWIKENKIRIIMIAVALLAVIGTVIVVTRRSGKAQTTDNNQSDVVINESSKEDVTTKKDDVIKESESTTEADKEEETTSKDDKNVEEETTPAAAEPTTPYVAPTTKPQAKPTTPYVAPTTKPQAKPTKPYVAPTTKPQAKPTTPQPTRPTEPATTAPVIHGKDGVILDTLYFNFNSGLEKLPESQAELGGPDRGTSVWTEDAGNIDIFGVGLIMGKSTKEDVEAYFGKPLYEKDTENGMVIQYAYKNVYLNFNFYKDTGKIRVILIDGVKGLDDV